MKAGQDNIGSLHVCEPSVPFVVGCLVGFLLIYGGAYYYTGTRGFKAMVGRFIYVPAQDVYGGFSTLKLAALPLGFTYSLLPCLPSDCSGFNCLRDPSFRNWIPIASFSLLLTSGFAVALLLITKRLWPKFTTLRRTVLISCSIGLLCDGIALVCWMPTYDKLWLQPLMFLSIMVTVVANEALERFDVPRRRQKAFILIGFGMFILVAGSNSSAAAYRHMESVPYLSEVDRIAGLVKPKDLLVGDWDSLLVLYQYIWIERQNAFNVPTIAIYEGRKSTDSLKERIERTEQVGGRVFFLGVLDLAEKRWTSEIGEYGPKYQDFDVYRNRSESVAVFQAEGGPITLRLLSSTHGRCPIGNGLSSAFTP